MSSKLQPPTRRGHAEEPFARAQDEFGARTGAADGEVVDGEAVLDDRAWRGVPAAPRLARASLSTRPGASTAAVQAVAAAAGGFVAGAALLGLVSRRQRRAAAPSRPRRRSARRTGRRGGTAEGGVGELVQIVATRSLLVDVHLVAGPPAPGQR